MLVDKLERKFVHIHPALRNVFYELPNINHPIAKKIATIILMREFDFIIQEARDILIYKLQGYKNKEIANKLNATYSHILYVMVEFRKYIKNNYMKGGYVDGC